MAAPDTEEFLVFRLGGEEYAIDILQVREIRAREPVTAIAGSPAFLSGVINLRGTIVPIVDLRVKLGLGEPTRDGVTIIMMLSGRLVGMRVEGVDDVARLAANDIRPAPEVGGRLPRRFIRGIAPLAERMLVVVDPGLLITDDEVAGAAVEAA